MWMTCQSNVHASSRKNLGPSGQLFLGVLRDPGQTASKGKAVCPHCTRSTRVSVVLPGTILYTTNNQKQLQQPHSRVRCVPNGAPVTTVVLYKPEYLVLYNNQPKLTPPTTTAATSPFKGYVQKGALLTRVARYDQVGFLFCNKNHCYFTIQGPCPERCCANQGCSLQPGWFLILYNNNNNENNNSVNLTISCLLQRSITPISGAYVSALGLVPLARILRNRSAASLHRSPRSRAMNMEL